MADALITQPATLDPAAAKRATARWQKITLAALFTGYAGYYICRSNLSVSTPLIVEEFAAAGIDGKQIGAMASLGTLFYAIGKVTNGLLVDFVGGRGLFLLGMLLSIGCTICFGLADGMLAFTILWCLNRYSQSMGWGALVKTSARWYPVTVHATVMGVLAMSYMIGDAAVRIYLGSLIRLGLGWRGVFFFAAASLGLIAVACFFTVKSSPRDVGGEEPPGNPHNFFAATGESPQPESLGRLVLPLLANPSFWLVCLMCFGMTLIRETFNFWTPTYLTTEAGLSKGAAAQWSMVFPLVGGISALVGGAASDRCRGKHGRVAVPALLLLCGALWLLSESSHKDDPVTALLLIGAVSFFLMAPYSFCSGVMALDMGGKKGSSTAAGIIDAAGYLGAIFSGSGIDYLARNYGWPRTFLALAGIAGLTALATVFYWVHQERLSARRERKPS